MLQPISGDLSARGAARRQPAKLAAMEAHFKTASNVPLYIGGIPDPAKQTVKYGIAVPGMLSFMVNGDTKSTVIGLDKFAPADRPPVTILHYAFQLMVALAGAMLTAGLVFLIAAIKKKQWFDKTWFWLLFALLTPAGFFSSRSRMDRYRGGQATLGNTGDSENLRLFNYHARNSLFFLCIYLGLHFFSHDGYLHALLPDKKSASV